jgi:hypothetical protein
MHKGARFRRENQQLAAIVELDSTQVVAGVQHFATGVAGQFR